MNRILTGGVNKRAGRERDVSRGKARQRWPCILPKAAPTVATAVESIVTNRTAIVLSKSQIFMSCDEFLYLNMSYNCACENSVKK